jgi:hypothetical protein
MVHYTLRFQTCYQYFTIKYGTKFVKESFNPLSAADVYIRHIL